MTESGRWRRPGTPSVGLFDGFLGLSVLGLGGIVAVRTFASTSTSLTIGVSALAPFLLVPAWGVLGLAAGTRRWRTALVAGVLSVIQLGFLLPEWGMGSSPEIGPESRTFTIATANLLKGNPIPGATFEQLADADADLILVQELTPAAAREIDALEVARDYPHRIVDALDGFDGSAIYSRHRLIEPETTWEGGLGMTSTLVEIHQTRFKLLNIHPRAPGNRASVPGWRVQHADIARRVAAYPGEVIVAGDFNATGQHAPVRHLLDLGLTDAHHKVGHRLSATWPANSRLTEVLRLDRVLTSDGFEAISSRRGEALGSDHRPVIVEVAVVDGESNSS